MELVAALLGIAVVVLGIVLVMMMRNGGDSTSDEDRRALEADVQALLKVQQELAGQINAVNATQIQSTESITQSVAQSQAKLTKEVNERLEKVDQRMGLTLTESAKTTAKSLGELSERLSTIDDAQKNIVGLADQVVSLQHILADNSTRGAWGEVQLEQIVEDMLPSFAFTMQATLGNGKIVDCLVNLPYPPGPVAVDAKFPLAAYENMLNAEDDASRATFARQLTADTRTHVKAIADKYVDQPIDEHTRTSESALMFIPSEAVYGELHANHPKVIEDSHKHKVYLVSPTTLMATLTTVRAILRDVEMRKQAGVIQSEVGKLLTDVVRLSDRVTSLDRHFDQAARDITLIKTSAGKIESRSEKIESLDLSDQDEIEGSDSGALPAG